MYADKTNSDTKTPQIAIKNHPPSKITSSSVNKAPKTAINVYERIPAKIIPPFLVVAMDLSSSLSEPTKAQIAHAMKYGISCSIMKLV